MASSNKGQRSSSNSRPVSAKPATKSTGPLSQSAKTSSASRPTGTKTASTPLSAKSGGTGAKSKLPSTPIGAKTGTKTTTPSTSIKAAATNAKAPSNSAKSAMPSRPLSAATKAPSRPIAGKTALSRTGSDSAVVKRAPISPVRQAKLEAQRRNKNAKQSVNWVTGAIVAALMLVVGFAIYQAIPKPSPAGGNAASSSTGKYGLLSNFTAGAKGNISAQGKVTTLSDGVQYVDVKVGSGPAVKSTDTITVNYTGWLTDGTKFDSSYDRGQPAQFPLSGVIKGWTEGLVGLQIGGERRLLIPAAEGYGASGQPPTIPPNATLIFDVTLVSIP